MTPEKGTIKLKLGDWYISAKLSNRQPKFPNQIILVDGSSIYGEYVNGVFVVQYYDQDLESDKSKENLINKIVKQFNYQFYFYTASNEPIAYILKPGKQN